MSERLTAPQAARYLGITEEELLRSYYRGLPPGNLGWKEGSDIVWNMADLVPPPPRAKVEMVTIESQLLSGPREGDELRCAYCGFVAKSKGGLTSHRRKHA